MAYKKYTPKHYLVLDTDPKTWYNIGVQIKSLSLERLYGLILRGMWTENTKEYKAVIREHGLNCLSRHLKQKFNDKRSILEIKDLIREVYHLS